MFNYSIELLKYHQNICRVIFLDFICSSEYIYFTSRLPDKTKAHGLDKVISLISIVFSTYVNLCILEIYLSGERDINLYILKNLVCYSFAPAFLRILAVTV